MALAPSTFLTTLVVQKLRLMGAERLKDFRDDLRPFGVVGSTNVNASKLPAQS